MKWKRKVGKANPQRKGPDLCDLNPPLKWSTYSGRQRRVTINHLTTNTITFIHTQTNRTNIITSSMTIFIV